MGDVKGQSSLRARGSRLTGAMVLLVIVLAASSVFLFVQYRTAVGKQSKSDKQQIAEITSRVEATVLLPIEQPTIATVADTTKLAEPQLAAQAKNGDQLLVYAKAKRVVLYRPSLKKIVDMFRVQTVQADNTLTTTR